MNNILQELIKKCDEAQATIMRVEICSKSTKNPRAIIKDYKGRIISLNYRNNKWE